MYISNMHNREHQQRIYYIYIYSKFSINLTLLFFKYKMRKNVIASNKIIFEDNVYNLKDKTCRKFHIYIDWTNFNKNLKT
jgi:hypothetical protein